MLRKINWDAMGITASLACAIHCAILPLFVSSLPLFGVNIVHNMAFEVGMVVLAFAIGVFTFYHGYRRHHHQLLPVGFFSLGMLLLVIKLFFEHYATWLLIPAVLCIVGAHLLNFRLCRLHGHAHADDCNH